MFGSAVRNLVRPGHRPARGRRPLAVEGLDERITPSVDQVFDPAAMGGVTLSTNVGYYNTTAEAAQTFAVGASGTLTEVDLYLYRFSGTIGDLIVDIRGTQANGLPTAAAGE